LLERVEPCCIVGGSRGSIAAGRGKHPLAEGARPATVAEGARNSATGAGVVHGRRNRRSRWPWLRPHLVHGLPARPGEGRVPARQRLGRRGQGSTHQRISAPDADGWREVLSHGSVSGAGGARPARPASASQRPPTCYPTDLHGKCFNYLSTAHRVATCKLPLGYFHCKGFRHLARDCKQRWKVPPSISSTVGAVPGAIAVVPGAATCGNDGRRRRRRRKRRHRPNGDDTVAATSITTDNLGRSAGAAQATSDYTTCAPTDHTSKPPPSTAALCFLEPDPLALAMCLSTGPPALVVSFDPVL
jgi:hypothetical protein